MDEYSYERNKYKSREIKWNIFQTHILLLAILLLQVAKLPFYCVTMISNSNSDFRLTNLILK